MQICSLNVRLKNDTMLDQQIRVITKLKLSRLLGEQDCRVIQCPYADVANESE